MLGRPLTPIQALSALRARLARRLRGQEGIALPTVLMMVIAGLAMGGAAVTASIGAQQTSTRDQASKEALAAADAGVQQALYRQNKVLLSDSLPCVVVGIAGDLLAGAALADGWCPEVTGTVGDTSFRYRVKPATLTGALMNEREVRVVSIGTSGDVSRRIAESARSKTGTAIFGGGDLVGLESLNMGSSKSVTGDVGSNSDVNLNSGTLCGDATYGYGQQFNNGGTQCAGFSSGEGEFTMPPPLQGNVSPVVSGTNAYNSNGRMFAGAGCTGGTCDTKTGNVGWNPTTRVLTLTGNATATLGGSLPYSLCRLDMQGNSQLIVARGASVKIFFDTPENCAPPNGDAPNPCTSGTYKQVDVRGNAKLVSTSADPKDFSLLFVGSSACATNVELSGNQSSVNEVVFYGPRTDMKLWGSATLRGAMTGKTVVTGGASVFIADPDITDFDVEVALQYQRERYIECAGAATASPPDANC